MPESVEVLLFSDLPQGKKEQVIENAFKRSADWVKHWGKELIYNGFQKKGNIAFCAFLGDKNVGFFRYSVIENRLVEGPKFSIGLPSLGKKPPYKTVGALLLEAAHKYSLEHSLVYTQRKPATLSEKRFQLRSHIGRKIAVKKRISGRRK